ncbi:MAG: lipid-A-disaccharide synthase-related protein [Cyanobacteria bacterium P01_A01_bin.37]
MDSSSVQRLLCLSNGHGEDAIAIRIVRALQHCSSSTDIVALPIVGKGDAYAHHNIPIVGPVKAMPSGGFIYMDGKQLARDVQGGLLSLTLTQLQFVRQWANTGGSILAAGDIVPLLFGWASGAPYAFVGTAKSEYYIRDEQRLLSRSSWFEQFESWSGSVYLPWERWLMQHPRCKAAFPRDTLTAKILQQWPISVFDVGNPMMDDLDLRHNADSPQLAQAVESATRTVVLLPGSRIPEAYANWTLILRSVQSTVQQSSDRPLLFLSAIAPSLDVASLSASLHQQNWQLTPDCETTENSTSLHTFTQGIHTLMLVQAGFTTCIHYADGAIAMAGTATEQFVGLGKPAFILPGKGPQFTPAFAEAQTRLLGPSVILVDDPNTMGACIDRVFNEPKQLQRIQSNGHRRMGKSGASERIAQILLQQFGWER